MRVPQPPLHWVDALAPVHPAHRQKKQKDQSRSIGSCYCPSVSGRVPPDSARLGSSCSLRIPHPSIPLSIESRIIHPFQGLGSAGLHTEGRAGSRRARTQIQTPEGMGPVHTERRAPRNRQMQIIRHILVNGSVHTGCKQHQKVCIQICLRVLCERGHKMATRPQPQTQSLSHSAISDPGSATTFSRCPT